MRSRKFTDEQISYLQTLSGLTRKEQQEEFDRKYGTTTNYYTFKWHMQKLGIASSGDCRFKKGHDPWNKNMSVEEYRTHFTDEEWYETIHRVLDAPIRRIYTVGDIVLRQRHDNLNEPWIVVSLEPTRYKALDRYIWEQNYGPIPDTHAIMHLDHDPMNCSLDNLRCVSKSYALTLFHWMKSYNPEINEATIKYCELMTAIKQAEYRLRTIQTERSE